MAKTIIKYLCEACLQEINPKAGILIKGQVKTILENEYPTVIDSNKEDVAYCRRCIKGLLFEEDLILQRKPRN